MSETFEIKVIDLISTLSIFSAQSNPLKIVAASISNSCISVFVLISRSKSILCFEISPLNFDISSCNLAEETFQDIRDSVKKSLHEIIISPIIVNELVISNQDLWCIGKDKLFNVDFLQKHNYSNLSSEQDDFMDISENNEFQAHHFESVINSNRLQAHNLPDNFFCQTCDLIDGFLVCYEDTKMLEWNVLLEAKNSSVSKNSLKYIHLFSFPTFYTKTIETENSMKGKAEKSLKPKIIFLETSNTFWKNWIDDDQRAPSNYTCIVGHPEGKIMYSIFSWARHSFNFKQISPFRQLYDIKQPVKNIYYADSLGELEESGVLIVIGKEEKLCLITTNRVFHDGDCIHEPKGLWILNMQIPSLVNDSIFLSDCIIHCSAVGNIWVTKFLNDDTTKIDGKYLKIITEATDFHNVKNISIADKVKGIFLMMTKSGQLYLMHCSKKNISLHKSLPCLMNGVLQQSLSLKKLIAVKQLQSKFFASMSTFASLKFGGTKKFQLECTVTEIEGPSKKLLMNIDLKDFDHLCLDPDFWFVSASVYNPFEMDTAIISKCKPFNLGQNICMEISMSTLCSSLSSPFPLYLEVGLVLHLPNYISNLDCSKEITKLLPLYVRTHTLIISELYLLKNKIKSLKTQKFIGQHGVKTVVQNLAADNLKNPLFRMFPVKPKRSYTVFYEYTLCLLKSTVEHLMKSSGKEMNAESCIFQLIARKSSLHVQDGNNLQYQNQPVSLTITPKEDRIHINISSFSIAHVLNLKLALSELFLEVKVHNEQDLSSNEASCVCIPAQILRKCEEISKDLLNMYGKDVHISEFIENAISSFSKLRKEVSEQLPF